MFTATLDATALRKALDVVGGLVTDGVNFDVTSAGLFCQSMDSAHVALVELSLGSEAFEAFELDGPTTIGVRLASLNAVLGCGSAGPRVTLSTDVGNDSVAIAFDSSDFSLRMLDIECERMELPEFEPGVIVEMPAARFQRLVKDLAMFGDTAHLECDDDGVRLTAKGDIGVARVCLHGDGSVVTVRSPVKTSYSLKYLNQFAKASNVSPIVRLAFSGDMPLCVAYEVGAHGRLRFFLAPRMDDDMASDAQDDDV